MFRRQKAQDEGEKEPLLDEGEAESLADFRPLVVLEFSSKTTPVTREWMKSKIEASKRQGGADLNAKLVVARDGEERVLLVSAPQERLLQGAEQMGLKKKYKDGSVRAFTFAERQNVEDYTESLEGMLTMSQSQYIIKVELDNIRALETENHIPGCSHPKARLYKGKSILSRMVSCHLLEKMYPVHNPEQLKRLQHDWYHLNKPKQLIGGQPIETIRGYFGESVAMYFSFLGHYTKALLVPTVIGVLYYLFNESGRNDFVIFAVFNMIWATVFLETWKRTSSAHAYNWGTLGRKVFEEPRAGFHGKLGVNPITGRSEPVYPSWKRLLRIYCVSFPIVILCMLVAVVVMMIYFWAENIAKAKHKEENTMLTQGLVLVPSIIYSVVIILMNQAYRTLAQYLTKNENHREQSAYENYLIVKLVLFDFVNCFLCLFYIAFIMQDMNYLRQSLAILLIVQQLVGQLQETLLPYLLMRKRIKKGEKSGLDHVSKPLHEIPRSKQAEAESLMDRYEGTFDDYLELFWQFGYVFLFSAVYPMAAFWALANNIMEIRTDAFKMCRIFQRPFMEPAANIGAWQTVFEVMGFIAVMTNMALIGMSPEIQPLLEGYTTVQKVLIFVAAEHLIIFIKVVLAFAIPDMPEWVETQMGRIEYQSTQALKKQDHHCSSPMPFPSLSPPLSSTLLLGKWLFIPAAGLVSSVLIDRPTSN
ncbi:anoctamin-10-like isoform X2 [Branchiostoma floridae x Branchiostoma japonicum]